MIKWWPLHVMATHHRKRQTRHQEVKRQAKGQDPRGSWWYDCCIYLQQLVAWLNCWKHTQPGIQ
jgi:hypothetical protein